EQTQNEEHTDLHEPCNSIVKAQKTALVDEVRLAHDEAGQVCSQEPAAVQVGGRGIGENHPGDGQDRVEAVNFKVNAVDNEDEQLAEADADGCANDGLQKEEVDQFYWAGRLAADDPNHRDG